MSRFFDLLIDTPLAFLGAIVLLLIIFVRPQEFIPALEGAPIVNLAFGLGVLGVVIESGLGKLRAFWTPQLPYVALWIVWAFLCTAKNVGVGEAVNTVRIDVVFQAVFFAIFLLALQTYDRLRATVVVFMLLTVFYCAVSIMQARAEYQCIVLRRDPSGQIDPSSGVSNGRLCEASFECEKGERDKTVQFDCEKAGPFDTFTTGHGRVRWRGKLADPNELSLFIVTSLTYAFALGSAVRSKWRNLLVIAFTGLVGYTVILSQSRGGVLILLVVFFVYFARRYGAKGIIVALALGGPLLLLGGRSGSEADQSADERIALLYDGVDMFRESFLMGKGVSQFQEYAWPPLTAHNSYLLPASELGLPGLFLWSVLMYASLKMPITIALAPPAGMDPRLHPMAVALSTSMLGMVVGIYFLTMNYSPIVWIYFGLAGTLYLAARHTAPHFVVRVSGKELAWLFVSDCAFIVFMYLFTRIKGRH